MGLALELVRQAFEGGKKVLLFSQFTGMLDILREALDANGIGHATIEGKTKDRQAEVKRFANDPKVSVFLLSLRAGGTGLTLVEADTVILFDPWWNPMVEAQAMDRAHRIGQTKTVNVYKLVTKGTVEEKVMDLQDRKRKLFDALVQETTEAMEDLTWADVQGLFV
jgi:SNF2 family DNA or RNA helicase